jgi:serine O-acetyltransferase
MLYTLKRYYQYDPAAKSYLEIALLYPGVKAVAFHRLAHALSRARIPFLPRLISELSRFLTGIDIHPGARIGRGLIIDHGMGLVIGETSVVGDDVILYQGVTLGGTDLSRTKRHPTVQDHVVIGAGAKVLGNIVIGRGSRIGANSVVVDSVPEHTTVAGIPARVISNHGIDVGLELHHQDIRE